MLLSAHRSLASQPPSCNNEQKLQEVMRILQSDNDQNIEEIGLYLGLFLSGSVAGYLGYCLLSSCCLCIAGCGIACCCCGVCKKCVTMKR